ncbi:unnamed protein product, partial [Didymodactylos carnosus]
NICLINVGSTEIIEKLVKKFNIAIVNKQNLAQEFSYCLSCFNTIRPDDLLMILDVDEYLNVKQADYIYENYHNYDQFYFEEVKYGYVYEQDKDLYNRSLLTTNVYRKPHVKLGEYVTIDLQRLFNCSTHYGWYSCDDSYGKTMIKYGRIRELGTHFHKTTMNVSKTLDVDMKFVRLNHYAIRTREDGLRKGQMWNKLGSKIGVIHTNKYFRIIYDDSILNSKRLK